jgi:hypothetical protein
MNGLLRTTATFLCGAVAASLVWGWQLFHLQLEYSVSAVAALQAQAGAGQRVILYLENPQPEDRRALSFMATNMVEGVSTGIDGCEARWPYLKIKERYSSDRLRFEEFLREHEKSIVRRKKA